MRDENIAYSFEPVGLPLAKPANGFFVGNRVNERLAKGPATVFFLLT